MKKQSISKDILIFLIGALLGFALIFSGESWKIYNLMLGGAMLIWLCNIVFCCFKIKRRAVTLIFHLTIFLFLYSRIVVLAFRGERWWERSSLGSNIFAVKTIALSTVAICLGTLILEFIYTRYYKKERPCKEKKSLISIEALRFVVRIGLAVCMGCFFLRELDKLMFMSGRPYADYYTFYVEDLPFFISFPASCMNYLLCMFLALKPKKKEAFLWLGVYVASAMPMLKIGARGDIMLNLLFAFTYYCLRSMYEKGWFGKIERIVAIACIPLMILFLGAYNYIRDGEEIKVSVSNLASDFLFKQGTTYDTVLQGFDNQDRLIGKDHKCYSLSAITDNVIYSSLGQKIFDAPEIGKGNCFKMAYNSHSFAHGISYVVLGPNYLSGEGRGSSYIIENYIDFGFVGVIVFSILLGIVCSGCMLLFGKRWLLSVIILNILLDLFFVARAETLSYIKFLFSYKFWVVIAGVLICALIVNKFTDKLNLKKYKPIRFILEH